MKTTLSIAAIVIAIIAALAIHRLRSIHKSEFSVCSSNAMHVDVACDSLMFDGADFSVGIMGAGGEGSIERIHNHKIPDSAVITFTPVVKERNNPSYTVKVDTTSIPKDANGKIIFTIIDEKTVTVKYEPYSKSDAP
jgi:hypothetical protein